SRLGTIREFSSLEIFQYTSLLDGYVTTILRYWAVTKQVKNYLPNEKELSNQTLLNSLKLSHHLY
ncbi:hypothetical protein, partial [Streptococcus pseudopneumoniae]